MPDVWITTQSAGITAYHTTNCQYVRDSEKMHQTPLADVKRRFPNLEECQICRDGPQAANASQGTRCPRCSEIVSRLPDHIPTCDGGHA